MDDETKKELKYMAIGMIIMIVVFILGSGILTWIF